MSASNVNEKNISAVQWSSAIIPLLEEGYDFKMPLEGLSMYPLLIGGRDEVIITTVLAKNLKPGDIVLFVRKDGTHVLHRIYRIKNKMFYLLGDAQTYIEGPIKEEDILAITVAIIRKGKTILCSNYFYRIISSLWMFLRPLRLIILKAVKILRH